MCMFVNKKNTPLKQTKAWKILQYEGGRWVTPVQGTRVKHNKLKTWAKRPTYITDIPNNSWSIFNAKDTLCIIQLEGGAIHCLRRKKDAEQHWLMNQHGFTGEYNDRAIFEVKGKGYVNHNDTEIAFKEIEFVDIINDWEI